VSIKLRPDITSPANHYLGTIRLDSITPVNHRWYNVVLKMEQSLKMALFVANLFWQNVCVHQQTEMSERWRWCGWMWKSRKDCREKGRSQKKKMNKKQIQARAED